MDKKNLFYLIAGMLSVIIIMLLISAGTNISSANSNGKYQGTAVQGGMFILDTETGIAKGFDIPTKQIITCDYLNETIEISKKK